MLASHSNEAKIAHTLAQLGCAAQNFCKIAGVGLTRFLQALNALPGKHFSDEQAAHLLEVLGELYELQLERRCDQRGAHVPINFIRVARRTRLPWLSVVLRRSHVGRERPHVGFTSS